MDGEGFETSEIQEEMNLPESSDIQSEDKPGDGAALNESYDDSNDAQSATAEPGEISQMRAAGESDIDEESEVLSDLVPDETSTQFVATLEKNATSENRKKAEVAQEALAVVNEIFLQRAAQIRGLLEKGNAAEAVEKLKSLVPEGELEQRLEEAGLDKDAINPDEVESFLRANLKKSELIQDVVLYFHVQENRRKTQQALEANQEDDEEAGDQPQTELSSDLSENDSGVLQEFTEWYKGFTEGPEDFLDRADVPGIMRAIFAIDGYGSHARSAMNGLEKTQSENEASTIAALTKVFSRKDATKIFFLNLVDRQNGSVSELPQLLDDLFNVKEEEKKKEKIALIKQRMVAAFKQCKPIIPSLKEQKAESINLSEAVMQLLLYHAEQLVNGESQQKKEN